jgi:spore coat polysaccharide biosynthesis protein SpsF
MRINLTIEARMTSSRLPGKVNLMLNGRSLLEYLIQNARESEYVDKIIVATTTNTADDVLVATADRLGVCHFRGSELNVLKRVTDAHKIAGSELSVLLTGDNPFVTSDLIDEAISGFLTSRCDYLTNSGPNRKYPDGLDVVVMKSELLEYSLNNATSASDYEHVCDVINKTNEYRKVYFVPDEPGKWKPDVSITVDTRSDYLKAQKIAEQLPRSYKYMDLLDAINVIGV